MIISKNFKCNFNSNYINSHFRVRLTSNKIIPLIRTNNKIPYFPNTLGNSNNHHFQTTIFPIASFLIKAHLTLSQIIQINFKIISNNKINK